MSQKVVVTKGRYLLCEGTANSIVRICQVFNSGKCKICGSEYKGDTNFLNFTQFFTTVGNKYYYWCTVLQQVSLNFPVVAQHSQLNTTSKSVISSPTDKNK